MRCFVVKEIRQANLDKRRQITADLVRIKKYPELKDLKKQLRRDLRKTYGYINYFLYYKGVQIFLGNEFKNHKYLVFTLNDEALNKMLKEYRNGLKFQPTISDYFIKSVRQRFSVQKYGKINFTPGSMLKIDNNLKKQKVFVAKSPQTPDPYLGIELEYASALSLEDIADRVVDSGLHKNLRAMRDGSITVTPSYPYQVELCFLTKASELDENLTKLKHVVRREYFQPNQSCGFHVHLDARSHDPKKMFHNLVCMQNLLFNLVAEFRRENQYCRPMDTPYFDEVDEHAPHAHWDAISKYAFFKHNTIEVRIHQSTCDLTVVAQWVKLLQKIAYYKGEPLKFGSWDDTMKQIDKLNLDTELLTYARKGS